MIAAVLKRNLKGPRCQADRDLYKQNMMETLQKYQHLSIVEGGVEDLILHENTVHGITLGTHPLQKTFAPETNNYIDSRWNAHYSPQSHFNNRNFLIRCHSFR